MSESDQEPNGRPAAIDVHDELAQGPLSSFHVQLAILLGGLIIFDGYDTVNPSYVVHYLVRSWHLTPSQGGLLVSSGLIGFLIGAAGHGLLADRYGRRGVLLSAVWLATIFTVLTPAMGVSLPSFCLARVITGIGLGVLLPLATTYMNEFAPRRFANTLPVWGVALGWATGASAASFAGIFLTPRFGWQSLFYLGSAAVLLAAGLQMALPESAKFLALRGRDLDLRTLFTRIWPSDAHRYRTASFNAASLPPSDSRGNIRALFASGYRRTTISIWIAAFLSLFGVYALSGWIPTVMMQRGETFAAGFAFGAVMQASSFLGALLGAYLIDRTGAAVQWMAVLWMSGGVAVALLTVWNTHATNTLFVAMAGFGIPGAQFLLNNYTARSYETGIRASAVGMELAVGRLGAILGPYISGVLQETYHSSGAMFGAVAAGALAAGFVVLTLPRNQHNLAAERINVGSVFAPEAQVGRTEH